MIQDNEIFEKRNLLNKLAVNFENIKRIDTAIAAELEKRIAFAEDCVKSLLSGNMDNDSEKEISSLFDMLFDIEESNYDSFFVGENVIRENIFPCDYIFKCIACTHHLIEYMLYYNEIQNKRISEGLPDDFIYGFYGKKTADIKINLNEKLTFNALMSYINLCGFQVLQLNYNSKENEAHLILDIQNKSYMFSVFTGIIKCYKGKFGDFKLK